MNYDQAGNSIRGFTSVQTNRDLQFNTRRYNLHVARIQLVNIARNKQNTPNSPSWSSLPHNPKKNPQLRQTEEGLQDITARNSAP